MVSGVGPSDSLNSVMALPWSSYSCSQEMGRRRGQPSELLSFQCMAVSLGGGERKGVCIPKETLFPPMGDCIHSHILMLMTLTSKSSTQNLSLEPHPIPALPGLSPGVSITQPASWPGWFPYRTKPELPKMPTTSNREKMFFVWEKDPLIELRQMSGGGTQGPGDNEEFWCKRERPGLRTSFLVL